MSDKLTCDDVLKYQHLASKVPAFLLKRMAKRNSNLVSKFESQIKPRLGNLSEHHKSTIDILLSSDIAHIQNVMAEAYDKTGTKQFDILANPDNAGFIQSNLDEFKKLL